MNHLLVIALVIAVISAKPQGNFVSVSQDTLGNYNFKYVAGSVARAESRDSYGNVVGAFSYIDANGVLRETQFTSGVDGYQPISDDIPIPVVDTPEVAQAKFAHLAVLHAAYLRLPTGLSF
ncbi:hypothetical protein PPYR_07085 [Photinus pyralis]|uniref:Cuticle protein 6 n=2 Tax=Photinus pyralis TaxID=7054 RepID=A0A5N4APD2_PHOPY|nr:cuticle protein 7-like [Photinus pyralis]KAB0799205.1 hypothetical protein PPYR_07085 [Photinus pyralis]